VSFEKKPCPAGTSRNAIIRRLCAILWILAGTDASQKVNLITPPLGLLEFLDRVKSNAKIYKIKSEADQLSLALGCQDEDILATSLILQPKRAPRIAVHPWNQKPTMKGNERRANPMQVYLLTGYPAQWMPPFGLPHLLKTEIDTSVLESPCLYIPAGIQHGWMAITPDELASLTDYAHWRQVFAA
jgi:prolyl-tRNA editing enzyme YbaK/EbsC (Cys-tRNA(Pro) deacylase)